MNNPQRPVPPAAFQPQRRGGLTKDTKKGSLNTVTNVMQRKPRETLQQTLPKPPAANANLPRRGMPLQAKVADVPPAANVNPPRKLVPMPGSGVIQQKPAPALISVYTPQLPVRVLQRASTHVDGNGNFVTERGAALGDYGYRQLRMRTVSTALRNTMYYAGGGKLKAVNIFKITLLHGWNITDSKTKARIAALDREVSPDPNTVNPLTAAQIEKSMPSTEEIQIVERANSLDNYVTLQGVGRLVAIRQWLQSHGIRADYFVEVMCYPASSGGAESLVNISQSYDAQESLLSRRLIGPAIYAGSALATVGALALGAWAGVRRWRGS